MSFKKLNPEILEALETNNFEVPTAFQKQILPIVKGGANVFCIGNKGCGKTTTLIISVMQKLKSKPEGGAPRALILVETKAEALKLKEAFEKFTKRTGLRIYTTNTLKRNTTGHRTG